MKSIAVVGNGGCSIHGIIHGWKLIIIFIMCCSVTGITRFFISVIHSSSGSTSNNNSIIVNITSISTRYNWQFLCSVEFYVGFLPEEKLPKLDVERTFLGVSWRKCQSGNRLKKYIPKSKSFEPTLALLFWHLLWQFQKQVRSVTPL